MFPKHATDEQLLAYFEGELNVFRRTRVRQHLNTCWSCRSRAAQWEGQIHLLAEAHRSSTYPSASEVDQKRREFFLEYTDLLHESRSQREFGVLQALTAFAIRLPVFSMWRAAAVSVLSIVAVLAGWSVLGPSALTPGHVLRAVQEAEQERYSGQLVHQSFQVELEQLKPREIRHAGQLDVWVDASGKRFSTRWNDQFGVLRRAVWRPNSKQEYVYDPQLSSTVVSVATEARSMDQTSLADLARYGVNITDIENGFSDWLRSRRSQPITFSSDLAAFAGQPGLKPTLERVRLGQGVQFRVRARRQVRGTAVEITLDVDCDSYLVSDQEIVLETDTNTVEVRLTDQRVEHVKPTAIHAAVFEPDRWLMPHEAPRVIPAPPKKRVRKASALREAVSVPIPSQSELDTREMQVRLALHRLGVCLGEPVEVVREPTKVLVRGLVESAARKQELLTALSEIKDLPNDSIDIQTVDDALSRLSPATGENVVASQSNADRPPDSEEERTQFIAVEIPMQARLAEYFRRHGEGTDAEPNLARRLALFSERTVSESKRALTEAWALRRLTQRYGTTYEMLSPLSRGLLEQMLQDHVAGLRNRATALHDHLGPVLAGIGPDSAVTAVSPRPSHPETNHENPVSWAERSAEAFQNIERIDSLIIALFAGTEFPLEVDSADPDQAIAITPEQALAYLRGTLLPAIVEHLKDLEGGLSQTQGQPLSAETEPKTLVRKEQ